MLGLGSADRTAWADIKLRFLSVIRVVGAVQDILSPIFQPLTSRAVNVVLSQAGMRRSRCSTPGPS